MPETEQCSDVICPIQFVVDLLDNKWSILVLRELFGGTRRTHQLLAALPGISTKTLTQRLRELENQGLIDRHVYAEIPPHVEYSLTPKGRQIQPVMIALHQVGSQWLEQDNRTYALTADIKYKLCVSHVQSCFDGDRYPTTRHLNNDYTRHLRHFSIVVLYDA